MSKKKLSPFQQSIKQCLDEITHNAESIENSLEDFEDECTNEGLNGNMLVLNVVNYADREKILNFIRREHWNVLDNTKY